VATIVNITFDCADPAALAAFWAEVLGRPAPEEVSPDVVQLSGTPNVLFIRVPESKTAKNRMHLDLGVDDLDAARARYESLGATFVHEKDEYGIRWFTFRDPEGNELCVAAMDAH